MPLGGREPRGVAVVVRGHKLLVMGRRPRRLRVRRAAGRRHRAGGDGRQAAVRELAEECTLDGDGGPAALRGRPRRPRGVVRAGRRARGRAGARWPRGRGAVRADDHYQPLWATGRRAADAAAPARRASATSSSTPSGRCGSTRPAPDDWPVVERLWQLYQHDLSEFRHSAPGPDGLFRHDQLTSYADAAGPPRLPRPARRRPVRLRPRPRARRRTRRDGWGSSS